MPPPPADVLILAGGLGTRLKSVVGDRVKPMAEVNGRPFLDIQIDYWAARGFSRFILCVGHLADGVRAHYRDTAERQYVFSEENEPLGTGGAMKLGANHIRTDSVLALNGDSFCPLDPAVLLETHRRSNAKATIAVVSAGDRRDGGFVEFTDKGDVVAFREKSDAQSRFINAGVYILNREFFDRISPGKACSVERDIFPAMIGAGLYAKAFDAAVHDIGTPERLEAFRSADRDGRLPR